MRLHFHIAVKITPKMVSEEETGNSDKAEGILVPSRLLSISKVLVFCLFNTSFAISFRTIKRTALFVLKGAAICTSSADPRDWD